MKKTLFVIAFFTIMPFLSAQVVNNSADIKFDTTIYDYGTIVKGDNGEHIFNFTNTGKAPLVISNVISSCGCATHTWSKDPIKPRQTGSIKVVYDTNRPGPFIKTITIHLNSKNSPVQLTIKGNVIAKRQ